MSLLEYLHKTTSTREITSIVFKTPLYFYYGLLKLNRNLRRTYVLWQKEILPQAFVQY